MDAEVKTNEKWSFETENDADLFIYILQGEGSFDPQSEQYIAEKHAVLFNEGDTFRVKAANKELKLLLFPGKPLREPVAWGGPIVMNTQEELKTAFRELDENTFIK